MQLSQLFKRYQPNQTDLQNSAMLTLSCTLATILNIAGLPQGIWAIIIATLLPFAKTGATARARHWSLCWVGLTSALAVAVTLLLNPVGDWIISWFLISTLILYSLPRYFPGSNAAGIFILIFMVIAHGFPGGTPLIAVHSALAILAGTAIAISLNIVFDRNRIVLPPIPQDKSLYLLQRAIRMAISIGFAIFIAHYFRIQNASWVALTVIVIDQNTLGASVKKAFHRLLGTVFGIIAGLILAHFLFSPYPFTRWSALLLVFVAFLFQRVSYALTIFFFTIILANIFYVLAQNQVTLLTFLLSRLGDLFFGVIIGVAGEMVLFPKSLVLCIRQGIMNLWHDIEIFLLTAEHQDRQAVLIRLHQDIDVILQNIKDFRYEPISLLFKRYHLAIELLLLVRQFLHDLENMPALSPELSAIILPTVQTLVIISRNPDLKTIPPLPTPAFSPDASAQKLLTDLQNLLRHYQKIAETPRWRLELE